MLREENGKNGTVKEEIALTENSSIRKTFFNVIHRFPHQV